MLFQWINLIYRIVRQDLSGLHQIVEDVTQKASIRQKAFWALGLLGKLESISIVTKALPRQGDYATAKRAENCLLTLCKKNPEDGFIELLDAFTSSYELYQSSRYGTREIDRLINTFVEDFINTYGTDAIDDLVNILLRPTSSSTQRNNVLQLLDKLSWSPTGEAGAVYYIFNRKWFKCHELGPQVIPVLFMLVASAYRDRIDPSDDLHPEFVLRALAEFGQEAIDTAMSLLDNQDQYLRQSALLFLGEVCKGAELEKVSALVQDQDPGVRRMAKVAEFNIVAKLDPSKALDYLLPMLVNEDDIHHIIYALRYVQDSRTLLELSKLSNKQESIYIMDICDSLEYLLINWEAIDYGVIVNLLHNIIFSGRGKSGSRYEAGLRALSLLGKCGTYAEDELLHIKMEDLWFFGEEGISTLISSLMSLNTTKSRGAIANYYSNNVGRCPREVIDFLCANGGPEVLPLLELAEEHYTEARTSDPDYHYYESAGCVFDPNIIPSAISRIKQAIEHTPPDNKSA